MRFDVDEYHNKYIGPAVARRAATTLYSHTLPSALEGRLWSRPVGLVGKQHRGLFVVTAQRALVV